MAVTIEIEEAAPASYPLIDDNAQPVAWSRIEAWINTRWPAREVVFFVQDDGTWIPPLKPFVATSYERWKSGEWETFTPEPSPLGVVVQGADEYRVIGTAGDDTDPPEIVIEAVRRLAAYLDETDKYPGSSKSGYNVGPVSIDVERSPSWMAKAMAYSGAADLLRAYRRRT